MTEVSEGLPQSYVTQPSGFLRDKIKALSHVMAQFESSSTITTSTFANLDISASAFIVQPYKDF